jgi:hypothetical protein
MKMPLSKLGPFEAKMERGAVVPSLFAAGIFGAQVRGNLFSTSAGIGTPKTLIILLTISPHFFAAKGAA